MATKFMETLQRLQLRKRLASLGGKAAGLDYRKGGMASKGFAANPDLASKMGKIGGSKSSRKGVKNKKK
jgi:general stress protein YciG